VQGVDQALVSPLAAASASSEPVMPVAAVVGEVAVRVGPPRTPSWSEFPEAAPS
jgi:hypothetical protein